MNPPPNRISPEAHHIRSKLQLRWNTESSCYEVYTTVHGGNGIFRWYKISNVTMKWYCSQFNLSEPKKESNHGIR